eukprot:g20046.t1
MSPRYLYCLTTSIAFEPVVAFRFAAYPTWVNFHHLTFGRVDFDPPRITKRTHHFDHGVQLLRRFREHDDIVCVEQTPQLSSGSRNLRDCMPALCTVPPTVQQVRR